MLHDPKRKKRLQVMDGWMFGSNSLWTETGGRGSLSWQLVILFVKRSPVRLCAAECSVSVLHLRHKGSDSLLQACCLSGAKTMKSSNSREEWLHSASVSASALFLTTGGHYPAPLCVMGKWPASLLERNWHTIIWGGEDLRLIVCRLHKPLPRLIEGI